MDHLRKLFFFNLLNTHTHTHTHIYIYGKEDEIREYTYTPIPKLHATVSVAHYLKKLLI